MTGLAIAPCALPAAIAAEYPFEGRYLALDAGRLHCVDEGPRAADPILFLHGNPTWSFLWRRQVLALRAEHRCVAPDHIGCGLSDKPARCRYDLAGHAGNVLRLIEALGLERITLVAQDWGGAIGLACVQRAPARFARLLVLNTAAFPGRMPLRIAVCRAPFVGPLLVERLNAFAGLLPRLGVAAPGQLTEAARAGYAFPYRTPAERVAIRRFVEDIPTSPGHPSWGALADAARGIEHFADRPAAIVWGQRDWCFTPRIRVEWQRRLPRAAVRALPDAGHLVPEEAPSAVLAALRALLAEPAEGR